MFQKITKLEDLAYEHLHNLIKENLENSPFNHGDIEIGAYVRGFRIMKMGAPRYHFSVNRTVDDYTIKFYAEILERIEGLEILILEGQKRGRPTWAIGILGVALQMTSP